MLYYGRIGVSRAILAYCRSRRDSGRREAGRGRRLSVIGRRYSAAAVAAIPGGVRRRCLDARLPQQNISSRSRRDSGGREAVPISAIPHLSRILYFQNAAVAAIPGGVRRGTPKLRIPALSREELAAVAAIPGGREAGKSTARLDTPPLHRAAVAAIPGGVGRAS